MDFILLMNQSTNQSSPQINTGLPYIFVDKNMLPLLA